MVGPEHEREVKKILEEELPDIPVSISYDVLPKWKEYERASTTLADAYVKPIVSRYTRTLKQRLKDKGITEVRYAGGTWDFGGNRAAALAIFTAPGLTPEMVFDFYRTSAESANRTTITGESTATLAGHEVQRLDSTTGERIQTVVVWASDDADIVNVVLTNDLPDPKIEDPTDIVVRITSTGICGSDLHLYEVLGPYLDPGDILGHEPMGLVEEVGPDVTTLSPGDRVVVPFNVSCGDCYMCGQGLQSQCETTQVRERGTECGEQRALPLRAGSGEESEPRGPGRGLRPRGRDRDERGADEDHPERDPGANGDRHTAMML